MSIKKLTAFITALAVLVFSFNAFAFSDSVAELFAGATAQVGTTDYSAYELKGNYTLSGTATNAILKWYVSDSIFGEYTELENQNAATLRYDCYESGKYVKFVVIPVDENGNEGAAVEAKPVRTFASYEENFETSSSADNVEVEVFDPSTGEYGISSDPENGNNNALKIKRTSTSTDSANKLHQSRLKYNLPDCGQPDSVAIKADIYAANDWSGQWETLYIMGTTTSGSAAQVAKFYLNNTTLKMEGKSSKVIVDNFSKERWYTIGIVLDLKNDKILS